MQWEWTHSAEDTVLLTLYVPPGSAHPSIRQQLPNYRVQYSRNQGPNTALFHRSTNHLDKKTKRIITNYHKSKELNKYS